MGFKARNFEIMTQERYLTKEEIEIALNEIDAKNGINHLKEYAYILHNKDAHKDGSPITPHWHILIRMDNSYDSSTIAKRFNVQEIFVNKIKSNFANALSYLTHHTSEAIKEGKYQYDDSEVISNYKWKNERENALKMLSKSSRKQEIRTLIGNGTIREYNIENFVNIDEYDDYKKTIDNAFAYRRKTIIHKGGNKNMDVIFICGTSGSGKTTYAKEYAQEKGYSYYVSSGSNDVLDGYEGQDCLILDDLRPSCMGLSDLLKMLDNHTSSSIKSRYYNKTLECKLIIITSILDIDTFFKNVFSEEKEPIKQLKRRCKIKMRMVDEFIYTSLYDERLGDYGKECEFPNPIYKKYEKKTYDSIEEYEEEVKKVMINIA